VQETIRCRRAKPADFLVIASLDRTSWAQNRNSSYIPDGEHVWRLWVEHGMTYCAWDATEIVGAIVAFPCLEGAFCVHKLFIRQDCRGRGIGTELFQVLLGELDRLEVDAFLTVDPLNEGAIRMYERIGFTEREFVPHYYREQEDRYVLTRRAKPTGVL